MLGPLFVNSPKGPTLDEVLKSNRALRDENAALTLSKDAMKKANLALNAENKMLHSQNESLRAELAEANRLIGLVYDANNG